jgi:hypothetical protein
MRSSSSTLMSSTAGGDLDSATFNAKTYISKHYKAINIIRYFKNFIKDKGIEDIIVKNNDLFSGIFHLMIPFNL